MARRKRTRTETEKLKNAKKMHKKDQRLNPTWFEAKRVDLASELITESAKRPPKWGSFIIKYKQEGKPTTILRVQ